MIADACGVPVIVPTGATEYGAKGAALLAAVAVGWHASVEETILDAQGDAVHFDPRPEAALPFARSYAVYRALRDDLRPTWLLSAGKAG